MCLIIVTLGATQKVARGPLTKPVSCQVEYIVENITDDCL